MTEWSREYVTHMLVGEKVRLRPKRREDALRDYRWRQDPELAELDASVPLDESFSDYQRGYVWELDHPARHRRRFAIETLQGLHIGNCAFFDIEDAAREAQVGIMIGERAYWGQGYGADAMHLMLDHIFGENGLESVYLRTLEWNFRAQKCFSKCGFQPTGKLNEGRHDFIIMNVTRERWKTLAETGRSRREQGEVESGSPPGRSP